MAKGSALDRVLLFYRTASPDTVRVTHQLAVEVMEDRGIGGRKVKHVVAGGKRGRKPRQAATPAVQEGEKAEAAHGG